MLENTWRIKWEPVKRWLILSACFTFFWGFFAHGYAIANGLINHDALAEFNGAVFGNVLKVGSGRFLVPLYQKLFHMNLALPWMIGLLSLLWLSISVFLTVEIFDVRSRMTAFMIAGIYTVNLAVTATMGSYLHDLDADMFGVMAAVGAVFCWRKLSATHGILLGGILTAVPLAIYQSNFSVVIELVLIVSILDLMNNVAFTQVMKKGLQAISMTLLGGLLYCALLPAVVSITGIPLRTGDYNTLDNIAKLSLSDFLCNLKPAYRSWLHYLHFELSPFPCKLFNGLLGLLSFAAGALWILDRKASVRSKVLCAILVCLLPLGATLAHVVLGETFHELMTYAIWLVYLLPLLLGEWLVKRLRVRCGKVSSQFPRFISVLMIFVYLYGNVQMSNTLYLKKELEADAFQSLMTEVVYDIDNTEDYVPGQTKVAFIGVSDQICPLPGTEAYGWYITGAANPGAIIFNERIYYEAYVNYILLRPIVMENYEIWSSLKKDSRVAIMPTYPEKGSIAFLDGTLVVHMG